MDEWSKSQNVSSEQTDRTEPQPPPQAQTEQVNAVFTRSGKSDDSLKTQKDSPPPIIVNNKIRKDKPIKTAKRDYQVIKTNEYPFREYIPKIPYPQALRVDHSHLNRKPFVKETGLTYDKDEGTVTLGISFVKETGLTYKTGLTNET
ncbi:hypothetical protein Tco_0767944 [Tanacetum coccineum]